MRATHVKMLEIERQNVCFLIPLLFADCDQFIYHLPVIRTNDKSFTYVEELLIHFSLQQQPRQWFENINKSLFFS